MFDWHFDSPQRHSGGGALTALGSEYLLSDSDELTPVTSAPHSASGSSSGSLGTTTTGSGSPGSTLVGSSNGLEINLIWDSSVQTSSDWKAIEAAVVSAAEIYTSTFSNHAVLNIEVGSGEVGGAALSSGALGESESLGYVTSYNTVVHALSNTDAGLVNSGLVSSHALGATSALTSDSFFVPSSEAKVLGLVSPTATAVDGYIGLASGSALYFPGNGGAIGSTQYDAVGVAAHELSEVMGRIGMEGQAGASHTKLYTPLDLFRYLAPNSLDVTPTAAYFSTNAGVTDLLSYNNPQDGGDAADLATSTANRTNSYDAFGTPGVIDSVTGSDLLEVAVLGYQVAPGKALNTVTA